MCLEIMMSPVHVLRNYVANAWNLQLKYVFLNLSMKIICLLFLKAKIDKSYNKIFHVNLHCKILSYPLHCLQNPIPKV